MKKNSIIWIFFAYSLFAQQIDETVEYIFPDETPVVSLIGWKVANGDSTTWCDPEYDDSHWEINPGVGLWINEGKSGTGVRWYRKTLFFPEPLDSLATLALYQIAVVSANEVYWDGRLIARNGQPGIDKKSEKTGLSGQIFPIPEILTTPGKHVIALRVSNFHSFSGVIESPLQLGYFARIHEYLFRVQALSIFLAGVFFLTALFHFAILLGHGNKWPYALFSAFCLSCAVYIFIRGLLRYFQIDLNHFYTLAAVNDIPWFLMLVLLPIFFLFEFSSPYKKRITTIIIIVGLAVVIVPRLATFGVVPISWLNTFDSANRINVYFTIFVSIAVAFWALYHRMIGSLSASIGLLVFLAGVYFGNRANIENGWAIGFAVLNIFLTISLSNQMAHRSRLHHEADLRGARLEIELLKKHIQPHFLLNSLNSIIAWLEEDPPVASRLVNALADELRMLLVFSGEKLILLSEEIKLCKAHLNVMSLRQDKKYSMTVEGIQGDEKLPPLVIHTLVENGLTHGYKEKESGVFKLNCIHMKNGLRLKFFNDSHYDTDQVLTHDGTGLRYVKTRLEEAFPSSWKLNYGPVEGGWEVVIEYKGAV